MTTRLQEEINAFEDYIEERVGQLAYEIGCQLIEDSGFVIYEDGNSFDIKIDMDGKDYIVAEIIGSGGLNNRQWWIEFNIRQDDWTSDNSLKIIVEEFASGEGKYGDDDEEE